MKIREGLGACLFFCVVLFLQVSGVFWRVSKAIQLFSSGYPQFEAKHYLYLRFGFGTLASRHGFGPKVVVAPNPEGPHGVYSDPFGPCTLKEGRTLREPWVGNSFLDCQGNPSVAHYREMVLTQGR